MEERMAKLEANVEHIRSGMGDMKLDIRRLSEKTDDIKESVGALALHVEKSFSELKVSRAMDRVWFLLMSAALLGIMARAFEWI